MERKQKAGLLFWIGIVIILLGAGQVYFTLATGRPVMAFIGVVCIVAATFCCVMNLQMWNERR